MPGIGFNYEKKAEHALRVAQFLNDHIAKVVSEGNGRFVGNSSGFAERIYFVVLCTDSVVIIALCVIGLCTVPMQDTNLAIQELRRCVLEHGMPGVQIGSHIQGKCLDDPQFEAFWQV